MALISNGTTIASGGSVSYNRLTDTPTIPTNTNQLTNGAGFLTSAPAPTTSQVLSATAGASTGAIGTYAFLYNNTGTNYTSAGGTLAGSSLRYGGSYDWYNSDTPSGTWRLLGNARQNNGSGGSSSVWLRIS